MENTFLDELQQSLIQAGPDVAIQRLCEELQSRQDYHALFYTLLMIKRLELGLSPIATASNQDLPPEVHASFEDAIREAGRTVGRLFLDAGNIPAAFAYYRMIGEVEPVRAALEKLHLKEDEDNQPLIEIAFHQGIYPEKGFDWILQIYGICNAITTLGTGEVPFGPEGRNYCIRRLVRALHEELLGRLQAEIAQQQGLQPAGKTITELIQERDWLFGEDQYHIDLSHLSSVVQMSSHLDSCEELQLARDLCTYGQRLSPRFLGQSDPPFENLYQDYEIYLSILAGVEVEKGLDHFRAKADQADPQEIGTYPAEVLINLFLRLHRPLEAVAVARKHLAHLGDARLSCPNLVELCQRTNAYATLAEVAREQNNPVNYLAGLIGEGKARPLAPSGRGVGGEGQTFAKPPPSPQPLSPKGRGALIFFTLLFPGIICSISRLGTGKF